VQPKIRVQKLDLADMASIKVAADEILEKEGSLDLLVNNAGVMAPPNRIETAQGLELQFGTNHVGHFMLTRMLLPNLLEGGRVVTVASAAHTMGHLDFSDLNYCRSRQYSPWSAYGQSKLANILFAKGLNDKLKESGRDILSVSLHPGVIGTNLWRYSPKILRPVLNAVIADRDVYQGAATSVYCSLIESDSLKGGEYFSDCAVGKPNEYGEDASGALRRKLWDTTESIIEEFGFQLPTCQHCSCW